MVFHWMLVFDPSKCSKLSLEQKRELVYELSNWSDGATDILQSWSRQEILQILCAELGKERKYTGLTKLKIIDHLLRVVCEKKSQVCGTASNPEAQHSQETGERTPKRPRKSDHPNRVLVAGNTATTNVLDGDLCNTTYCKNSACKAKLSNGDVFCKRCSCCICHQYDDNKDPSLWLVCNSDPPFHGNSCGMSCHLECALKHEKSGITKDRQDEGLDGSFCCMSCGKVNDLLSSWRKQLIVARDTRRVDILCYRLSLSQKILAGTKHYQDLYGIMDTAVKKLEEEVGPLTGLPVKKARGIVNRLTSGPEVQRLCASVVDSLDLMLSNRVSAVPFDHDMLAAQLIRLEDVDVSSLMVILNCADSNLGNVTGYTLWYRKADDADYPAEPTFRLFTPNSRYLLSGLTPDTHYLLKVVPHGSNGDVGMCEVRFQTSSSPNKFSDVNSKSLEVDRSQSPATNCSSLSNPSSVEDETNNVVPCSNGDDNREGNYLGYCRNVDKTASINLLNDTNNCSDERQKETTRNAVPLLDEEHNADDVNIKNKDSSDGQMVKKTSPDNGSNNPRPTGLECVPYTPCKLENVKDGIGKNNGPKLAGKDLDIVSRRDEPQAGSSSKKSIGERLDEECSGIGDKDFEYYVKVIRWLECNGHIEATFRQKFLTWYSLRANPQEVRVVKVFIDTFIEDPASLAGQLVDSFSDVISNKSSSMVPAGFCMKLWH
ncbi:VIN3 2 [Olea europaea subsp. europaea]|uniref:VIN3 2 n=1 Tax=Olea europaea subsp. europaea TaxID=158383 RepID=A0A8S0SGW1_OLEEU|nr:VIN3 2 [Olea europaea subsp. europaea]